MLGGGISCSVVLWVCYALFSLLDFFLFNFFVPFLFILPCIFLILIQTVLVTRVSWSNCGGCNVTLSDIKETEVVIPFKTDMSATSRGSNGLGKNLILCVENLTVNYSVSFSHDTGAYQTNETLCCPAANGAKWESTFVTGRSDSSFTPLALMDQSYREQCEQCSITSHIMTDGDLNDCICDISNSQITNYCFCKVFEKINLFYDTKTNQNHNHHPLQHRVDMTQFRTSVMLSKTARHSLKRLDLTNLIWPSEILHFQITLMTLPVLVESN